MNCENLQLDLPLYLDDVLSDEVRGALDGHLARCPLCRQKLDDFRDLRLGLGELAVFDSPRDLVGSVRTALRTELEPARRRSYFSADFLDFLKMRVMPATAGVAGSLMFGFSLLWLLLSGIGGVNETIAERPDRTTVFVTGSPGAGRGDSNDILPSDLVAERIAVSGESPSVNPQGALIALAQSLARGKFRADELVVVADVLSNGSVHVEEVVEPSGDEKAVFEIERAIETDPAETPFVPATLEKRADSVRVVLKIQRVDVKGRR